MLVAACGSSATKSEPMDESRTANALPEEKPDEKLVEPEPAVESDNGDGKDETAPTPEPEPTLESLASSVPAAEDASKTAWSHYKAEEFDEAVAFFAQAALTERGAWKHPFNLACAAARAGQPELSRLGLREAVARDAAAAVAKARKDKDLASVRSESWFEPTLAGEADSPEPDPTPLPAPTGGNEAPPGKKSPIGAPDRARIANAIQEQHGVAAKVLASFSSPGDTHGWVLYELSLMDLCLREATKKACRDKLRQEDVGVEDRRKCKEINLVRAKLSDPTELAEPFGLKLPCKASKVRRFDGVDIDRDGKLEVLVDVTDEFTSSGAHDSDIVDHARHVVILRHDGTSQLDMPLAWGMSEFAPPSAEATRIEYPDHNGDGHPDLLLRTVEFVGSEESVEQVYDDIFVKALDEEGENAPETVAIRLYEPDNDEWGAPKKP